MRGDHRHVGVRFLGWISGAFLLGLLLAVFVKLLALGRGAADGRLVAQLSTYHGLVMVFLCIVPALPAILGHALLPRWLRADGLALPRLARAALRLYALGTIVLLLSVARGAVAVGWTLSPPSALTAGGAFILVASGLFLVALSWFLIGVNLIATVHHRRGPGVAFWDLPVGAWGIYLGAYQLVVGGILFAVSVLYLAAARAFGTGLFSAGYDPLVWQNYFWFALRPAAVMALVPAAGVISEVIAGISRKPLAGYRTVVGSLIALLAVSFAGWGVQLSGWGPPAAQSFVFAVLNLLPVVPTALIVFSWLATLQRGATEGGAAAVLVVAFLLLAGVGALLGLVQSHLALGAYVGTTVMGTAHIHFVMMGGVITALLAALHHWWPELLGRTYAQTPARLAAFLYLIGVSLAFFPQIVLGLGGRPAGLMGDSAPTGWLTAELIGLAVLTLAVVWLAANLIAAIADPRRRSRPQADLSE